MEYDWNAGAKRCYDRLSQDFHKVRKVVEAGDLEKACDMWMFTKYGESKE